MFKKTFGTILTITVIIGSIPFVSTWEARLIHVSAQINEALVINTKALDFEAVFPQEKLDRTFTIFLGSSTQGEVTSQFAASVITFNQGKRKNGTNVIADRSNPAKALGAPQSTGAFYDNPVVPNSYFSLGFASGSIPAGSITLGFTNFIVNVLGPDIKIFEVTGGSSYPDEKIKVEASQDNITYVLLAASVARDADIDLGSLPWAKYVRITDVSDKSLFEATADGYDLDAVRATSVTSLGGDVKYSIRQKPKCIDQEGGHPLVGEDANGNFVCPSGSTIMPMLCPYLSKHEITTDGNSENDSAGINAFHGLPLPWTANTTDETETDGLLSNDSKDLEDTWNIDLRVPCYRGECAQDWQGYVKQESGNPQINAEIYKADPANKGKLFGCDLWVEVTGL